MLLTQSFDTLVNLVSFIALIVSVYVFFSDTLRRWNFFGFKPSALIIIFDDKSDKVLLAKSDYQGKTVLDYKWHLPQGGIYSTDMNTVVDSILSRDFGIDPRMYIFKRVVPLGVRKLKNRQIGKKYFYGSISIYPHLRGKGYLACVLYTDLNSFVRKITNGYGVVEVRALPFEKALKMINPQKAEMIKKAKKEILSG